MYFIEMFLYNYLSHEIQHHFLVHFILLIYSDILILLHLLLLNKSGKINVTARFP